MEKDSKKQRNSNIELLRIIAILFILMSHYSIYTPIDKNSLSFGFNKVLLDALEVGPLGVAIFVMITGYFMSKTKFNINRTINIVLQTLFYSVGIFVVFSIVDRDKFSLSGLFKSMFPVITGQYWFITAFVILSLLVPFLNNVINNISRKKFIILLSVLFFYVSFAPTFFMFSSYSYLGHMGYMITFYLFGAYIRIYPDNILSLKKHLSVFLIVVSAFVMLLSVILIMLANNYFSGFPASPIYFYSVNSVIFLILAISLLSYFVNKEPMQNRLINTVGGCTLGVYLISEHILLRDVIWKRVFNNESFADSYLLIVHLIISVLSVFVVCCLIEWIRKTLFEKNLFKKLYCFVYKLLYRVKSGLYNTIEKMIE